ncbi:hypothetical protein UCRNP2_9086 [Neofusicoccum parvum UCRNP2]|uniref:Uncharacterized protein n=1 Tax=Botryosphaeria parva (strain UCR-NP2) TaxID=1287680 RepID=R1GE36_BOTPV|nr:hypothetical protein UCRNP2_9086 [Neofusicoccum parvum UCRNP2]
MAPQQPPTPSLADTVNKDMWAGPPMPLQYTSPVAVYQQRNLPLNLVALILEYVCWTLSSCARWTLANRKPSQIDDIGDLARVVRTSRLLYYMTLPRLYERVELRSYSELRYKDNGRPEGYGSGSPFAMGLNGLVTKNVAQYVRSWRLLGDWRESDLEDFSKGRVPDNSMMLNIAVRAAMERMERLQHFAWELNTKPLQTIYQGLQARSTLQSLVLKFPNTRVPRPTVVIPPLPNLREFKARDIDPLCYPDDISILLAHSKKLESLHLHWSPRMRDAGEESTNLSAYFGRCIANKAPLKLKRYSMVNLYTRATNIDLDELIDVDTLEEINFINCNTQDAITVFIDDTWRLFEPQKIPKNLKTMRGDVLDAKQASVMSQLNGLQHLYIVNAKRKPTRTSPNGVSPAANNNQFAPDLSSQSPFAPGTGSNGPDTPMSRESATIAGDYLAAITRHLGKTLKHLLLSDQWLLGGDVLVQLGRACPHLEQLGVALEEKNPENMRQVLRSLPRLWALRILIRATTQELELMQSISGNLHEQVISFELRRREWDRLKYLGIGDMVFQCGGVREVPGAGTPKSPMDPTTGEELGVRRIVKKVDREAVNHVEIWKMDCLEVI